MHEFMLRKREKMDMLHAVVSLAMMMMLDGGVCYLLKRVLFLLYEP